MWMERCPGVHILSLVVVLGACTTGGARSDRPDGAAAGAAGSGTSGTSGTPTGGSSGGTSGGSVSGGATSGTADGPSDARTGADASEGADAAQAMDAPASRGDTPDEGGGRACGGLLCEDFETGAIDPAKWDVVMGGGGTLTVQQQTVAHGKHALKVHGASGPTDWALLVAKNVPAELKGVATFGRAYFWISAPLTSGHTQMVFAGNTGTGAANGPAPFPKLRYMEVANINAGWQLGFDLLDVAPLVEEVSYPKGQVPTGKWVCLEWQFDDEPDHITMWLDGAPSGTFDGSDIAYSSPDPIPKPDSGIYKGRSTDIVGGFDVFGFGFHDWHPQKPFDLYYDDLVLDSARVGCLP
jgi:hypothetical protein